MYESLGTVTLKTGEVVDCGVVHGPDAGWADRVNQLLIHKTRPWDRQITQCVTRTDLGIQVSFYLLHRKGIPFSNIMTPMLDGVGLLGHVFTTPEDRRKHATSLLMERQMAHFRSSGGRALYLGTVFASPAFHIYQSMGFVGLEPASGIMDYYNPTCGSRESFEADYFGKPADPTLIEPLSWRHWPASAPLFSSPFDGKAGVVRMAGPNLLGRALAEEPVLNLLLRDQELAGKGAPPQAAALRNTRTGAVLGMASWQTDPIWSSVTVADVYCHPDHWSRTGDLLAALKLPPDAARTIVYADPACPAKLAALARAGFHPAETLKGHAYADAAKTHKVDVVVCENR